MAANVSDHLCLLIVKITVGQYIIVDVFIQRLQTFLSSFFMS